MVFLNFQHGSVSENSLTLLKRKPKNSKIAKFESYLLKKRYSSAKSQNSTDIRLMEGTNL